MLHISQLSKNFGKLRALDAVSVELRRGQAVSLVGPNGSGKTTFIKCILGLVVPDGGQIEVAGQPVLGGWEYRNHIGYMPQIGRYPDNMQVRQVFELIREVRGGQGPCDEDLMRAFEVKKFEDKTMRTLSGGTRQKVSACLAFLFDPDILILDEPTAGLDPLAAEILKEKILAEKQRGKLILLTSHILSDLEDVTTDVLYIMDGKIKLYQPIDALKSDTGEQRLNRAIASIMKQYEA
ncbi:MAG: ABC transporter ATP-binding protein [Saprospiraceae bacterium]